MMRFLESAGCDTRVIKPLFILWLAIVAVTGIHYAVTQGIESPRVEQVK